VSADSDSEGDVEGELVLSSDAPESRSSPAQAVATKRVPTARTAAR
jgi:hypothetical protein